MKGFVRWGLSLSVLMYAFLHFVSYFFTQEMLVNMLAAFSTTIFISTTVLLKFKRMKVPITLFFTGILIMVFSDVSITEGYKNGLLQMRNIVGLLIIIPMINWVLTDGSYMESIIRFSHKQINTSRKFYLSVASFTQVIAYFLLFGAIPVMYQFLNRILGSTKDEMWQKFKSTSILRGFALSTMWVISMPSFAFVIDAMNASVWISVIQGLGISIAGIIMAQLFFSYEEKQYGAILQDKLLSVFDTAFIPHVNEHQIRKEVAEFLILFITLFGTIFILQAVWSIELLVLIPLTIILWLICYYLLKKNPQELFEQSKHYFNNMVSHSYQFCVMIGVGVLIFALNQTNFATVVVKGIYDMQKVFPFINVFYLLPLMVVVLGFFALGPLTVMVLMGGILESLNLPYPPELIVLAVTSGSAISVLFSPLIMPLIMLSNINGLNSFKIGFMFNWKFAAAIYVFVQFYIQLRIL